MDKVGSRKQKKDILKIHLIVVSLSNNSKGVGMSRASVVFASLCCWGDRQLRGKENHFELLPIFPVSDDDVGNGRNSSPVRQKFPIPLLYVVTESQPSRRKFLNFYLDRARVNGNTLRRPTESI